MDNHQYINKDSGNTEWWTPKPIVAVAKRIMGGIDLDPACSTEAWNYHEKHALVHYSENGINQGWFGRVWMNHPFGRNSNSLWINRLNAAYDAGFVQQACCITFASISEKWFQPLLQYPQFFFCGRINYIDPVTLNPIRGVTKGSLFTYLYDRNRFDYELARRTLRDTMELEGFTGVAK